MLQEQKNILVTGSSGFIAHHLADRLDYVGIDKRPGKYTTYQGDMCNRDFLIYVFSKHKFDTVFHLAANSDISKGDPLTEFKDTLTTTFNILDIGAANGIKNFVFSSSSAVYGNVKGYISEDYPHNPISYYGSAKSASESFIKSYAYNHGIKSWILRFPNVVGGKSTHGVIRDLLRKNKQNSESLTVFGNGLQLKPYMHVSELLDAVLYVLENANELINIYNISVDGRTSVKEIAEMITGNDIVYTGRSWAGDCEHYLLSTEKLSYLGWKSKISSTDSVLMAINEIKKEL